jgi:hypothetical protein
MPQITFKIAGTEETICVSSTDQHIVDWAERYLSGMCHKFTEIEAPTFKVKVIFSDLIVQKYFDIINKIEHQVVFGFDSREILKINTDKFYEDYFDPSTPVLYRQSDRDYTIVLASRSRWPALEVARFVREIIVGHLQKEGWTVIHAAAVSFNNRAVLIAGPKGAGKTTTLIGLIAAGFQYISNDRVLIKGNLNRIDLIPFSGTIDIGLGTLLDYEWGESTIRQWETLLYPQRRLRADEVLKLPTSRWSELADKICLMPEELVRLFSGSAHKQSAILSIALFPKIVEGNKNRISFSNINERETVNILQESIVTTLGDKSFPHWLGGIAEQPSFPNLELLGVSGLRLTLEKGATASQEFRTLGEDIRKNFK